jgi:hypothetical protein
MGEERLRRKRRSRGEDRREGQLEAAVEWWVVDGECKLVREIVTSIGTRRDFDEGEPAAAAIRLCGVGDCVIVIVVLSLPPFPSSYPAILSLRYSTSLSLLSHTHPKRSSQAKRQSRQCPGIATQGKSRWSSAKGKRETRVARRSRVNARIASLTRLVSPVSLA